MPRRALAAASLLLAACATTPHPVPAPLPPAVTAVTLVVGPVEGLGLFLDESAEAERLVHDWGRAQGLALVPLDHAATIHQRARAGHRIEDDRACGRPLARWRATSRYARALGATGKLSADINCDDKGAACTLNVTAWSATDWSGKELLRRVAPYDMRLPWREALAHAVAALAAPPADESGGGGLGLLGGMASGVVEARPEQLAFSAHPALASDRREYHTFDGALSLEGGPAPLRACFDSGATGTELLIAIDGEGRITRCESREADDYTSQCACGVMRKHGRLGAVLRSTRAWVGASFRPADQVTPWKALVTATTRTYLDSYRSPSGQTLFRPRVSDPSIHDWAPPPDAEIARCFLDEKQPGMLDARVTVGFEGTGAVDSVTVEPRGKRSPSAVQAMCLRAAFRNAIAPCPDVWSSTAQADVHVSVQPLGAKIPSPFQ